MSVENPPQKKSSFIVSALDLIRRGVALQKQAAARLFFALPLPSQKTGARAATGPYKKAVIFFGDAAAVDIGPTSAA